MKYSQSHLLQQFQRLIFLLALLLLSAFLTFAQALPVKTGTVSFSSAKKKVSSENTSFKSTIDLTAKTITYEVDMAGFSFEKDVQKKHYDSENGANVASFTSATFSGNIITEQDLTAIGEHKVIVKGKLNVLGTELDFETPALITVTEEGVATQAEFLLNREKFGIIAKYASMLDDDLKIKVSANY